VHREALKRVGVNWQNINGSAWRRCSARSARASPSPPRSRPAAAVGLLRLTGGNFDALIDFLATQNQATMLAEPNLVAMSGETASFLAAARFP
jgi:Flp pilus assembly secretin CpaC